MNERTGNVYENKGSLWKTRERSWNVCENKGTYPLMAGMLLKIKGFNVGPRKTMATSNDNLSIMACVALIPPIGLFRRLQLPCARPESQPFGRPGLRLCLTKFDLAGCGRTCCSGLCSAGILPASDESKGVAGWKPALRPAPREFFRSLLEA
jgi:hypothetical protein